MGVFTSLLGIPAHHIATTFYQNLLHFKTLLSKIIVC